jgi:hypothetical protein
MHSALFRLALLVLLILLCGLCYWIMLLLPLILLDLHGTATVTDGVVRHMFAQHQQLQVVSSLMHLLGQCIETYCASSARSVCILLSSLCHLHTFQAFHPSGDFSIALAAVLAY